MGSVSSVNPGVANLLQTLSNVGSPLVSSQSDVSAIEAAPASDIAEMSAEADQLQAVDMLFGGADAEMGYPTIGMGVFSSLEATLAGAAQGSPSASNPLAGYQSSLQGDVQAAEADASLDPESTSGADSLFSLLG